MQSRTEISRARWQLWAATFAIMTSLAGIVIYLATSSDPIVQIPNLPSRALLAMALAGMVIAFLMYAIDRERQMVRLADRLIAEQLESERLAARLQYLAELTRERDTNAAILDGTADGVVVVDGQRRIRRFNRSMEELAGVEARAVVGSDLCEALRLRDASGVDLSAKLHPATLVLADGVARSGIELQLARPDGGIRWVSATFSPIFENDEPVVLLATLRDITEHKELEAMQRDFVSMAAHELRSPLTAIKGFTRTLITKADRIEDDRRARYLAMVNEQSDRLARLVDDLMQVSRIDAHRLTLERDFVDLGVMVETLVEQFRAKWAGRTIEVVAALDLQPAFADPHKLEEILINLIDNAVKYSPADAPVEVRLLQEPDGIRIDVVDHGPGISTEEQAELFQKFHRLPASKANDIPGTGLGLYIVRGFVEAHGGRVWLSSEPGEGSTFSLTLPAADESSMDAPVAADVARG